MKKKMEKDIQTEIQKIISDLKTTYRVMTNDGYHTFYGILQEMYTNDAFESQLTEWSLPTQLTYLQNYYSNRILPHTPNTFIGSFSVDDIEEIIERIKCSHHDSTENILDTCRYLIWRVIDAAIKNNLCYSDIRWDPPSKRLTTTPYAKQGTVIKSLILEETCVLLTYFSELNPTEVSGEVIGSMLQFFEGVRNQCAAGLVFSAFRTWEDLEMITCYIYQSVKANSNEPQESAKSANAPRTLPVIQFLADFVKNRLNYIKKEVAEGRYILPPNKGVEDLPIACKGHNYGELCSSEDINRSTKEIFRMLGICNPNRLFSALYEIQFFNRINYNEENLERDPTAYVARRDYATRQTYNNHPLEDVQYLVGHEIDDLDAYRSQYANLEKLAGINQKLRLDIFNVFFSGIIDLKIDLIDENPVVIADESVINYNFIANVGDIINLQFQCNEPMDNVTIECDGKFQCHATQTHFAPPRGYPDTVNIQRIVATEFMKIKEKIENNEQLNDYNSYNSL